MTSTLRLLPARAGLVLGVLLGVSAGHGQTLEIDPSPGFDRGIRLTTGVRYESYDEDRPDLLGERLGQLNVFGLASALLRSGVRLDVGTGWSETNWHQLGEVSTLNDTKVELTWRATEHLMLGGGVNAPTGKTDLDLGQLRLAQGVSSRIKAYSISKFGEGTDLNARAAYAVRLGAFNVAAGAGALFKGEYDIVAGEGDYDPGDQITFSLGSDVGPPERLWRTNASYTLYETDTLDDRDVFEFGNRLRLETLYRSRGSALAWLLRARAIVREDSKIIDPTATIDTEASEDQSTEFYVDGTTDVALAGPIGLVTLAGARFFGDNDRGIGSGHRIDLGGGLRWSARRMNVVVRGRGSFGRLDVEALESPGGRRRLSFTGWGVEGAVTRTAW